MIANDFLHNIYIRKRWELINIAPLQKPLKRFNSSGKLGGEKKLVRLQ
jgi:hypothetical protein